MQERSFLENELTLREQNEGPETSGTELSHMTPVLWDCGSYLGHLQPGAPVSSVPGSSPRDCLKDLGI